MKWWWILFGTFCFFYTTSATATPIAVKDSRGKIIRLSSPAKRIVGLSPHIIENLFAIGAGKQIVGAVQYADYPAEALSIPRVGGFSSLSLEVILTLKPDLVIAWGTGNGAEIVQQLEALAIPVYVDEPKSISAIAQSLDHFAQLTGRESAAEKIINQFSQQLSNLRSTITRTPVRVFYQIWHEPMQTINGQHLINEVIEICGGANIFADSPVIAPKISIESVIQRNPDIIIASGADANRPKWLDEWKQWPQINAVKQNKLYYIPPDYLQRHTPRIFQGMKQVCALLKNSG